MTIDADKLKKAIGKIQRYNPDYNDELTRFHNQRLRSMVERKKGKWVLWEDVKTVICQAIADVKGE